MQSQRATEAVYIRDAQDAHDMQSVRVLLREYQRALGVDLCFQGFEAELAQLPGGYAAPYGRLLLAMRDADVLGCIALQRVDDERGEMKRLYVRPSARGTGLGRALVKRILDEARTIGYREIVLDTLPSMIEAQRMYEGFGFRDIPPYRENPIVGSRYMGLKLR